MASKLNGRLSPRQIQFFDALLSDAPTPSQVMLSNLDISPNELVDWLKQRGFRREYQRRRKVIRFTQEVDLLRGAAAGIRKLLVGTATDEEATKISESERRSSFDLARLAGVGKPKVKRAPHHSSIAAHHPDVSDAEASDLVDQLDAKSTAND